VEVTFFKKRNVYQLVSQFQSYFFQRIFAYKKYNSIKDGYQVFFKRYYKQDRFRRFLKHMLTSGSFLVPALRRVGGNVTLFSYLPIQ